MLKVGKAFSGHWLPTNSLSKQQRNCETMVSPMGLFSDSPASDRPPGVFRPGLSLQPVLPRKSPSPCINVIPSFHFPSSKNCHWNFPQLQFTVTLHWGNSHGVKMWWHHRGMNGLSPLWDMFVQKYGEINLYLIIERASCFPCLLLVDLPFWAKRVFWHQLYSLWSQTHHLNPFLYLASSCDVTSGKQTFFLGKRGKECRFTYQIIKLKMITEDLTKICLNLTFLDRKIIFCLE